MKEPTLTTVHLMTVRSAEEESHIRLGICTPTNACKSPAAGHRSAEVFPPFLRPSTVTGWTSQEVQIKWEGERMWSLSLRISKENKPNEEEVFRLSPRPEKRPPEWALMGTTRDGRVLGVSGARWLSSSTSHPSSPLTCPFFLLSPGHTKYKSRGREKASIRRNWIQLRDTGLYQASSIFPVSWHLLPNTDITEQKPPWFIHPPR